MAHRVFPDVLKRLIVSSPIFPVEDQDVLRTGKRTIQTIRRGPTNWRGVVTIRSLGRGPQSQAALRELRAFVTSLERQANTFDAPLPGRAGSLPDGTALTLAAVPSINGGLLRVVVAGLPSGEGLLRGDMVTIGGQVYELQSDAAAGAFNALPARIIGEMGDSVTWDYPTQKARLVENGFTSNRDGLPSSQLQGPFSFSWESSL